VRQMEGFPSGYTCAEQKGCCGEMKNIGAAGTSANCGDADYSSTYVPVMSSSPALDLGDLVAGKRGDRQRSTCLNKRNTPDVPLCTVAQKAADEHAGGHGKMCCADCRVTANHKETPQSCDAISNHCTRK
jgi:hypothetical protein